jgi:cytochrome o ubiquinol oxidase subunit 2
MKPPPFHAAACARLGRRLGMLAALPLLSGCNTIVLHPFGDVAMQQRDLLVVSTVLMLIIIVPVMGLTVLFAWHYRAANATARYEPEWHHSTQLELVIWSAPLLIVMCLGALTWMGTHILDPYRALERISPARPLTAQATPLRVDVVALDWKWLFLYPEQGIATLNEIAAPVNRPLDFHITSASVMNSLYIPALAGQIYAMPAMETRLHAVINRAGDYAGFSANYSGAGFSGMRFRFHGLTDADFAAWVARVKADGGALTADAYRVLERPSEDEPVRHFATVGADLYHKILNLCVDAGKMCMDNMMRIDAQGGLGLAGVHNVLPLEYDKYARRGAVLAAEPGFVASICDTADAPKAAEPPRPGPRDPTRLAGMGLDPPGLLRRPSAASLR